MLNENVVFSDPDHKQYANYSAQKIILYFEYLKKLEKWFGESGWELPLPCRTNFRDAWFHYKKLYERRDSVKIFQEEYALEEHLIRAVKDAIICYFQIYIKKMERVYFCLDKNGLKSYVAPERIEEIKKITDPITVNMEQWDIEVGKYVDVNKNMLLYLECVCYIYARDMDCHQVAGELQKCLHKIKNYYSKLRLNGTEIYRPSDEEEYMEECGLVFMQMMKCLKDNRLERAIHIIAKLIKVKKLEQ